jgi:hypothetical protein
MGSAYGLAASALSWERRIFEAATSSIARVIFAVLWTERIRRRVCLSCPAATF